METCAPIEIEPHEPSTYDPSTTPSSKDSWALPYNSVFAKAVKHHRKTSDYTNMIVLVTPRVLESVHTEGWDYFLASAQSGCQVMLIPLISQRQTESGDEVYQVDLGAPQKTSLTVRHCRTTPICSTPCK